jgi:hypothetical protein
LELKYFQGLNSFKSISPWFFVVTLNLVMGPVFYERFSDAN